MAAAHGAGAERQRPAHHLVDAEQVQGRGHADRVDDGVHPADLVQVHLVHGHAVQVRLDPRDRRDGPGGQLGHRGRAGARDHLLQFGRPARRDAVGHPDPGPGGQQGTPLDALHVERPAGQPRGVDGGADAVERRAEPQQRPEQHVTGHPAERVEPDDHRGRARARRCAAIAAAKPESMFTTVTPAAQELSIASSAVTPSSAAP